MNDDRFADLLGPYVLGELRAEEEREIERHLDRCPRCRADLEDIRSASCALRHAAGVGAPPPDLKGWVLARARGGSRGEAGEARGGRTGPGGRRGPWVAAAVLLVAAVLGVGVFRATTEAPPGDPPGGLPLAATALAPGASGELRGEKAGENLRVELEVRDLPELRGGEYYEVWYARKDGGRISCGTFGVGPGGDATVSMSAPTGSVSYPEVEVTREPDDGNPDTSGDKVLLGTLRDL